MFLMLQGTYRYSCLKKVTMLKERSPSETGHISHMLQMCVGVVAYIMNLLPVPKNHWALIPVGVRIPDQIACWSLLAF